MILFSGRCALAISALALAPALISAPALADVLEIDNGEARWVAGGTAVPAADSAVAPALPLTEIPVGMVGFLPESAVADAGAGHAIVPALYADKVSELSARYDLSPALIEALVWQESRWRENAVSPVGARGLAQLMPGTAAYLGVDSADPLANLEGGARYLREQLDRFDGDLEKALAAYNAGPGRVERAGGIPRIRETQNYVVSIMGRLSNYSRSSQ